jgi:hypothetical protein
LLIYDGSSWTVVQGRLTGDDFVCSDGKRFDRALLDRASDGSFVLAISPVQLVDYNRFRSSLRGVVLSSLFDNAGDASLILRNVAYGGLIVAVLYLALQLNVLGGRVGDVMASLDVIQASLAAPVEVQIK